MSGFTGGTAPEVLCSKVLLREGGSGAGSGAGVGRGEIGSVEVLEAGAREVEGSGGDIGVGVFCGEAMMVGFEALGLCS